MFWFFKIVALLIKLSFERRIAYFPLFWDINLIWINSLTKTFLEVLLEYLPRFLPKRMTWIYDNANTLDTFKKYVFIGFWVLLTRFGENTSSPNGDM